MRRYKIFFINGFILLITSIFMRGISMFFNIYISNKIGAKAVGIFTLVMSVYMLFITFATSGLNFACTILVSSESNEPSCMKNIMKNCLKISVFFGIVSSLLLFVLSDFISVKFLNNSIPSYILKIMAISLPFISISSSFSGYFTGLRKVHKNSACRIFEQFIKMGVIFLFLSYILPDGIEFAILSLIIGEVLSEILSFIFNVYLYYKDIKKMHSKTLSKKYTKRILQIILPISVTSYIKSGLSSLKQFLIPNKLALSGISYQDAISSFGKINGMAMPLLMFPDVITSSFSSLLVTEFSYYKSQGKQKEMRDIIHKIFNVSFIFVFMIFGIFFFYAQDIGMLFYGNNEIGRIYKIAKPSYYSYIFR